MAVMMRTPGIAISRCEASFSRCERSIWRSSIIDAITDLAEMVKLQFNELAKGTGKILAEHSFVEFCDVLGFIGTTMPNSASNPRT
ncbi:MAG: hypothetical protein M3O62_11675 [Pseudomonadota bacterium]|nr:hypothetical protein [Pseudomonadota bacterium]